VRVSSELLARVSGARLLRAGRSGRARSARRPYSSLRSSSRADRARFSWELRAAISLARLRQTQERAREALEMLSQLFQRFSERFETSDLIRARLLLRELES
jgi:hypothetical protein